MSGISLTVPIVGGDVDTWGEVLDTQTFPEIVAFLTTATNTIAPPRGLLGCTMRDPADAPATKTLAAATQTFCSLMVPQDIAPVTISYNLTTAATVNTHGYVSLYGSDGSMIAQSADQSTLWQTTGLKTTAIAPGTITGGDSKYIWVCFYCGTSTIAPVFSASNATSAIVNIGLTAATGLRSATLALADTATMPAVTPSSMTGTAGPILAALT